MGVLCTSLRYHDSETLRRRLTAPKGREEDRVRQKVLGESRSKFRQGLRELTVRLKSGRAGSLANHSYGTVCDSIKLDRFSVRAFAKSRSRRKLASQSQLCKIPLLFLAKQTLWWFAVIVMEIPS